MLLEFIENNIHDSNHIMLHYMAVNKVLLYCLIIKVVVFFFAFTFTFTSACAFIPYFEYYCTTSYCCFV